MKKYKVNFDPGAERDLEDIVDFIAGNDSPERAIHVASSIQRRIAALEAFPNRGVHPKELLEYGNRDFREIYFKPYRIFYRVRDRDVVIVLVTDGRRDMRTLLTRRLLGA